MTKITKIMILSFLLFMASPVINSFAINLLEDDMIKIKKIINKAVPKTKNGLKIMVCNKFENYQLELFKGKFRIPLLKKDIADISNAENHIYGRHIPFEIYFINGKFDKIIIFERDGRLKATINSKVLFDNEIL